MSTVVVEIDVSRPAGVKLVQDLQHKRVVTFLPPSSLGETSYSHSEVWSMLEKKFNDHYGTNCKFPINEAV
ncbi:MAG: hypothetical protein LBU90_10270 [Bacteroidales bacterium]|jgi:hypothetical protein|nr:hypothetical protein [Bacteroidales bacterium]